MGCFGDLRGGVKGPVGAIDPKKKGVEEQEEEEEEEE